MSERQQGPSHAKAFVLVLLLYVLGMFLSGLLVRQGLSATWGELAFRGVLVLSGALLFHSSKAAYVLRSNALSGRDLAFFGILAFGLIAAGISGLLGSAANDPDLRSGGLPPTAVLIIQLAFGSAGEELMFVGFLYGSFRREMSVSKACAIVGVLFVLLHWPATIIGVISRVVYILAACSLFERCRNIALNIGLHVAVNGTLLLTVLLVDDRVPFAAFFASFGLAAAAGLSAMVAAAAVRYGWPLRVSRHGWNAAASASSDFPSAS